MKIIEYANKQIVFQVILLITVFFSYTSLANAQVTIGSELAPQKAALLDLKDKHFDNSEETATKGLLLPRVKLVNAYDLRPLIDLSDPDYNALKITHKGLTVYNVGAVPSQNLTQGVYIWDGEKWQKAAGYKGPKDFFYMPSIAINTTQKGVATLDLYSLYKQQFQSPKVSSAGAPASIPYFANATDLYYYVTDYDTNIFSNISISNSGVMTYTITDTASPASFINIVFVIK